MSDAAPPPRGSSERRWAVEVRIYFRGKLDDGSPFLAGRFYFNRHGDRRSNDEHPPTATFRTREQARKRCAWVRKNKPGWRVTAHAVPVLVTTALTPDSRP